MAGTTNNAGTAALKAVGKIEKATGTVEVVHPDGTRGVLHAGDIVYKGDVVATSGDGSVGIVFADASTFSLGKSGRMAIDELVYDPDSQSGQSALSVVKGAFSFASGQIAKTAPDATTIKTPVMTIGIRGTTVAGQAGAEGEENSIALLPDADGNVGQLIVSNAGGTMVLNSPNNVVQLFSSYQPPPPPVYISPAQIQSQYGNATDSRPPSPPAGTPPQQIVPNFQPSAPAPAAPETAPQQQQTPQNTPAPEQQGGGSSNTDHPVVSYTPPVDVNGPKPTTTPPVLPQLQELQKDVAQNANDAGANVSVDQTSSTGSEETKTPLELIQQQTVTTAEQTQQQIEQQASQNNSGSTAGNSSNNNNDNANNNNNSNNGNSNTQTFNGRAIDGYVANATVFRDMDDDGILDAGEASTTTDASGNYNLSGSGGVIVVTGGTDTTTGKPLTFTMKAAAGSTVVTPLTTLVIEIAGTGAGTSALAAAEEKVRNMLGLSAGVSLTSLDPVASLGSSQAANQVMAAIAKIVSTVNMVAALTNDGTNPGISASDMMAFLAQKIQDNTDINATLTDPTLLRSLLASVPNISNYLDYSELSLFSDSLASANSTLSDTIETASSYSEVSSRISASTSTDGALITAVKSIVDGTWNLNDMDVVFGNGSTPGILSQLKAAGIADFTFSAGSKIITAAQAANIHVTLGGTASLTVMDNGANLTQYVGSIYNCFTALVLTGGTFHLDSAELGNLWGIITKASGTIVCDLADGDSLTSASGDLANMLATADRIEIAADATVNLGLLVLSSAEPLTLGAGAKIIAVADDGNVDLSGVTYLSGATKLLVPAGTTVTLDATLWSFFTTNDHALMRENGTGLFHLNATGDLTGLNLSMCDQLLVGASNVVLTMAQWDALEGPAHIGFDEVGGKIDLKITGITDLTTPHHEFATFVANGMISSLTVAAGSTVTLDAAVLLGWLNAGKNIVLSVGADITVEGDISGFATDYPNYAATYFDHVVATHAPTADPAAVFTVPSGGGTITIGASDLDGDNLTYEVTGASRGGTLTYTSNGQFTYTPPQNTNGADTFTVTISDGTHTVTQEVAVLVSSGAGSPGFYTYAGDYIEAMLPGELVDASFTLSPGSVEAATEVTVVVYLSTEDEPATGSLLVGGQAVGALWTMTGTIADINAQLAELQYQAPGAIAADGRDYIHVVLYNNGKTSTVGFSANYHAPNTFTGETGTAWSDSDNWSAGLPTTHDVVVIDADSIENPDNKALVGSNSNVLQDTILVRNGATLEVQGSLTLQEVSTVDVASHLVISGTGEFVNDGTLNLSGDVTVGADATFTNTGTIEIGGQADQTNDGSGFATVTVTGDVMFDAYSCLTLEIGGNYTAPSYDKLIFSSGNIDLNGEVDINVDPLGGYLDAPTELTLMTGVGNIDDVTFGTTYNSNDHAIVGIIYDSNLDTLTAKVESFGDGEVATLGCSTGQDFVFGAKELQNLVYNIEDGDTATGGSLDDTFRVAADGDGTVLWSIEGGSGTDTLELAAGSQYAITSGNVSGIETFDVGAGEIILSLQHESTATVDDIGYNDAIYAGAEDDTFVVSNGDFYTIAGGDGNDTLKFTTDGLSTTTPTSLARVSGIETIDLTASTGTLTLTSSSVGSLAGINTLTVMGQDDDTLTLSGYWTQGNTSNGYTSYTDDSSHSVQIDSDVQVHISLP